MKPRFSQLSFVSLQFSQTVFTVITVITRFTANCVRHVLNLGVKPGISQTRRTSPPLSALLHWCMHAHRMSPVIVCVGLLLGAFDIACVVGQQRAIIRRVAQLEIVWPAVSSFYQQSLAGTAIRTAD